MRSLSNPTGAGSVSQPQFPETLRDASRMRRKNVLTAALAIRIGLALSIKGVLPNFAVGLVEHGGARERTRGIVSRPSSGGDTGLVHFFFVGFYVSRRRVCGTWSGK